MGSIRPAPNRWQTGFRWFALPATGVAYAISGYTELLPRLRRKKSPLYHSPRVADVCSTSRPRIGSRCRYVPLPSAPLKETAAGENRETSAPQYSATMRVRFHSLHAIFTGHFFHFIARHPHATLTHKLAPVTGFADECPARKAAALAKASVNKVVFHSTNATVCHQPGRSRRASGSFRRYWRQE